MKKKLLVLMLLLTIMSLLFSACNESEQKQQPSNNQPKTTESKQQAKKEDNAEKILEVLKSTADITNFAEGRNYGRFMANIDYDDSVKNPYNNKTAIHVINRNESILDQQDNNYSGYSASIVIIDDYTSFLKNLDKIEVTYGCNPKNKGVVMAFVYQDGFYIYEVDQNGNKQNEIIYMLPGYEYPEWVDEYKE